MHAESIQKENGFTLLEVMITVAISTIVLGAVFGFFNRLNRSSTTQSVTSVVQQDLRSAMDYMSGILMEAGLDPLDVGAGIVTAGSTDIQFTYDSDVDGALTGTDPAERVRFWLSGNNLMVTENGTSTSTLLDNVGAFQLTYYDEDNDEIVSPSSSEERAKIQSIGILLTVQEPSGRDELLSRTLSTRVSCRNL